MMEIQGYENYIIYEDGRVYNQKYNRFLKQYVDTGGYFNVNLSKDGKKKHYLIHRLIGQYYIHNPENKPCIDHIDRNRQNNDISNLRWVTHKENSNNCSIRKNNKSGHKNIYYRKSRNRWVFEKEGYKQIYFKTIEEAIDYKLTLTID